MKPSTLHPTVAFALLLAGAAVLAAQQPTPLLTRPADQLIAVLKSDATHKEKADACRQLAVVGTREAVPALAALLADDKLNHMARYALETIPDPSAVQALREALSRLKGRPLVGVIGSLGVRRDAQATDALAGLLADADPDVAQAAARALGKIGTGAAARAIQGALSRTPAGNRLAFFEGLLRCAEALTAAGQPAEAGAIFRDLLKADAPHQVRTAAVRGAVLTGGNEGLAVLRDSLVHEDYRVFAAAVRTALEMKGPEVTRVLAGALDRLPPDNQIVTIQALGQRGDPAALTKLFTFTRPGVVQPVRLAAIRAIPMISQHPATPTLIEAGPVRVLTDLLADPDREVAEAAQESLAALPGEEADQAVLALLRHTEPARRLTGLELAGRRRMSAQVPALLALATDADARVRVAALKQVGDLGTAANLPTVLDLLLKAQEGRDLDAAEQAVNALCAKAQDPESQARTITGLMAQAGPAQKRALLGVLSALSGPTALQAVRAALKDPSAEVRAVAIRELGEWKTADAAPDLLALARSGSDAKEKARALGAYLGLTANAELPTDQRLSMCRQAGELVQTTEEKKLLLSALGKTPSADALALTAPYLDEPAVKAEAGAAVVAIADGLLKGPEADRMAARLVEPLQKVVNAAPNPDRAKRAQNLLRQARNKARGTGR